MQKFFTPKAFLLLTLLFVGIALFSFAAFHETVEVSTSVKNTCNAIKASKNSEMLWEVVSRQFLSVVSL